MKANTLGIAELTAAIEKAPDGKVAVMLMVHVQDDVLALLPAKDQADLQQLDRLLQMNETSWRVL